MVFAIPCVIFGKLDILKKLSPRAGPWVRSASTKVGARLLTYKRKTATKSLANKIDHCHSLIGVAFQVPTPVSHFIHPWFLQ